MAHAPPSYQAAAYRQLWIIVAPYVHSYDLYRACLVCRQWHQLFAPFLWGDPARKFGFDDDNIYLNLTRFKRLLTRARLEVRRLAHTLHIPPAQPEFYDGPQAGWLRDILDRLPCLQALIVSNLSFFDHSSLQGIHQRRPSITTYPLKLLIASNCENITAASLTTALLHFPELIYLDLSSAQGSRSPYVLRQIGTLTELRVLKLQNCGLRDDDIDHLRFSGLRSLDVSCNLLTERGLKKLFAKLPTTASLNGNVSPLARRYSGVPLPTRVVAHGLDKFIVKRLTSGIDGYLGVEEGLPPAFSHLDVASNYFTVNVLGHFASRHSLQHLDCGSLNLSQKPHGARSPHSPGPVVRRLSDPLEIDVLSPAIFTHAFRDLRYLRIHHSVVTAQPFSGDGISAEDQCCELHTEELKYKADSMEVGHPEVFELDSTSIMPPEPEGIVHARFESPDDVAAQIHATEFVPIYDGPRSLAGNSRPVESKPEVRVTFAQSEEDIKSSRPIPIRSHKVLTPADQPSSFDSSYDMESQVKIILPDEMKTLGTCWEMRNTDKGRPSPRSTPLPISVSPETTQRPKVPPRPPTSAPNGPERFQNSYTKVNTSQPPQKTKNVSQLLTDSSQRLHNLNTRERHPGRFKPSFLPNLKSLTLTSIPSTTYRHTIPNTLSLLIREFAEEEELARLREVSKYQSMNKPPPHRSPASTLKLKSLILEMTSQPDPILPHHSHPSLTRTQPNRQSMSKRASFSSHHTYTKSSTEDPDSESFMNCITSDFSFFGEDDGGLLVSEGRIDSPNPGRGSFDVSTGFGGEERELDVVMELSAFRRAKKREFEEAGERGVWDVDNVLGGYWRGEVRVVRESGRG